MTIKFGEWISVNEAVPALSKNVLMLIALESKFDDIAVGYFDMDLIYNDCQFHHWIGEMMSTDELTPLVNRDDYQITHWMPLPSFPKDIENE